MRLNFKSYETKKLNSFFDFLFLLHSLAAQNINGLEIPVGKYQRSSITFHSEITGIVPSDKTMPYRVATIGSNMVTIETEKEVQTSYGLTITEGGRKHRFVLVYKGTIDLSDQDKDFSDLKALDRLVKSMPSNTLQETSPGKSASVDNPPHVDNPPVVNNPPVIDNPPADSFSQLVEAADKSKKMVSLRMPKQNMNRYYSNDLIMIMRKRSLRK